MTQAKNVASSILLDNNTIRIKDWDYKKYNPEAWSFQIVPVKFNAKRQVRRASLGE